MREIKFRAWEPESEMGKPGNMSYNQDFCMSQIQNPDGCIVMQFTGLRDRNGVEIYEGDVYRWQGYEVQNGKQLRPFRNAVVDMDPYKLSQVKTIIDTNGTLEVIGNIHEHPELLRDLREARETEAQMKP